MPQLTNPLSSDGLKPWLERWRRLSADSRSIVVVALLAALVAAAIVTILWTSSRDFVPLYGKQELYDTAAILEVLETEGIDFRLDDRSGQVLVTKDLVASARMKLAARGITAQLPPGIDSLKDMSSVSTSQFMENTRYTHAVEGELARTIMTLEGVRNVRVHLAIPKRTLFVGREEQSPTASVMLDLTAPLNESQVESIVNLIAGSVPGMKSGAVSVVDQKGRLLSAGLNAEEPARVSGKQMEYISQLESRIVRRASDMLEPLLGTSNFRIRVAADVDFSKVEETREVLDAQPILLSENRVLDNATDQLAMGIPGALANQPPIPAPEGAADEAGNNAQQATSRREEVSLRYETGKAITHTQFSQGRLRHLSVSVLINDAVAPEGGWTQAQLDRIGEMVRTAVGFTAERGDQFSLQNAPFIAQESVFPPERPLSWWEQLTAMESYVRYALGSLLLFFLIIFGIRPLVKHLTRRHEAVSLTPIQEEEPSVAALLEDATEAKADKALSPAQQPEPEEQTLSLPPPGSELEVQLKHLRLLVDKETIRVAEVIKAWVQDSGRSN